MVSYAKTTVMTKRTVVNSENRSKYEELRKKQQKADNKLVTGIFKNLEDPGGTIQFPYRKHKEDDIVTYTLTDGERYDLPLCVARHLNTGTRIEVPLDVCDMHGNPVKQIKYKECFQFVNEEYM